MGEAPPTDLTSFLQTGFPDAKRDIQEIQDLTEEVVETFSEYFLNDDAVWPYQLVSDQPPRSLDPYSYSTTAMILFALSLTTDRIRKSSLVPALSRIPATRDVEGAAAMRRTVDAQIKKALDRLVRESQKLRTEKGQCPTATVQETQEAPLTRSSTFGCDDPFTLSWLLEVVSSPLSSAEHADYRGLLETRADVIVRHVLKIQDPMRDVLQIDDDQRVSHSFPLLRVLQLGETRARSKGIGISEAEDVSRVHKLLFERINLHLAAADMVDGRFDAGDLVFSLEGWILSSPVKPNLAVVNRVFEVLSEAQEQTPYWRALRPFKVTEQGLALLPQSIEVANSLLRICHSRHFRSMDYFSKLRSLFDQYSRWLQGRTFRGRVADDGTKTGFVGWESDHTYTLDRIHLWQTSQALIFLQHYAAMLQQYVADTSFKLAHLRVREPEHKPGIWAKWTSGDPLADDGSADSPYHVYEDIGVDFISPRGSGNLADASFSMLLYGPPGTGKSTIAKKIAAQLNYRLVTVTPSDFIMGGAEEVEARARAIFDVLGEQSELVVLFDEIDHLLLDRDSKLYRDQSDVFKLLTPGMLTKLGELSGIRRVLLIVATNYYERIDRAIKRPGRIDRRYLVLPPNRKQRLKKLAEELTEQEWKAMSEAERQKADRGTFQSKEWAAISPGLKDEIAQKTVHSTYTELIDLVAYVWNRSRGLRGDDLGKAMLKAIRDLPSLITLKGYALRFGYESSTGDKVPEQFQPDTVELPLEEFALLAYLQREGQEPFPDAPFWMRKMVATAIEDGSVRDGQIEQELRTFLDLARSGSPSPQK
jgi:DNA polymerase III delta prime subunit